MAISTVLPLSVPEMGGDRARAFATTPEQMAVGAALISMTSVIAGLGISLQLDTPAGPSIVLVMTALFAATVPWLLRKHGA